MRDKAGDKASKGLIVIGGVGSVSQETGKDKGKVVFEYWKREQDKADKKS